MYNIVTDRHSFAFQYTFFRDHHAESIKTNAEKSHILLFFFKKKSFIKTLLPMALFVNQFRASNHAANKAIMTAHSFNIK